MYVSFYIENDRLVNQNNNIIDSLVCKVLIYIYLLHFRVSKDRIHWIGHILCPWLCITDSNSFNSNTFFGNLGLYWYDESREGETSMKKNYNKIWKISRILYIYIYIKIYSKYEYIQQSDHSIWPFMTIQFMVLWKIVSISLQKRKLNFLWTLFHIS